MLKIIFRDIHTDEDVREVEGYNAERKFQTFEEAKSYAEGYCNRFYSELSFEIVEV